MLAKRFFYVCAGLFLLALTYHLGARGATAQAGATGFGFAEVSGDAYVMTPNGDLFMRSHGNAENGLSGYPLKYLGNFWGGATASTPTTWGKVKADYHK